VGRVGGRQWGLRGGKRGARRHPIDQKKKLIEPSVGARKSGAERDDGTTKSMISKIKHKIDQNHSKRKMEMSNLIARKVQGRAWRWYGTSTFKKKADS